MLLSPFGKQCSTGSFCQLQWTCWYYVTRNRSWLWDFVEVPLRMLILHSFAIMYSWTCWGSLWATTKSEDLSLGDAWSRRLHMSLVLNSFCRNQIASAFVTFMVQWWEWNGSAWSGSPSIGLVTPITSTDFLMHEMIHLAIRSVEDHDESRSQEFSSRYEGLLLKGLLGLFLLAFHGDFL